MSRLSPTVRAVRAVLLPALIMLPAAAQHLAAQNFSWYQSVLDWDPNYGSWTVTDLVAVSDGAIVVGVRTTEESRSGFMFAWSGQGDSLRGELLPTYTDASAQPVNPYYLYDVQTVRHPEGGSWIWMLHSSARQGIERPFVSIRHRISSGGEVLASDTIAGRVETVYPDGSATHDHWTTYRYRQGSTVEFDRWGAALGEVDSIRIDIAGLLRTFRGFPEIVWSHVASTGGLFLLSDQYTGETVLLAEPFDDLPERSVRFEGNPFIGHDAEILRSGEILVAGRDLTWDPVVSARVRLSWIDADGYVQREVTIDREPEGPVQIVGETTGGEIIAAWYESGSIAVYRLSPEGTILGRAHVAGTVNQELRLGPDDAIWMAWEYTYFGRLNVDGLSTVGPGGPLRWDLDLD